MDAVHSVHQPGREEFDPSCKGCQAEAERLYLEAVRRTRACVECGCTEAKACPGGCSWASLDPPVCSQCALVLEVARRRGLMEFDFSGDLLEALRA